MLEHVLRAIGSLQVLPLQSFPSCCCESILLYFVRSFLLAHALKSCESHGRTRTSATGPFRSKAPARCPQLSEKLSERR